MTRPVCNTIGMMYEGTRALAGPGALKERLPGVLVQIDRERPAQAADLLAGLPWRATPRCTALVHLTPGDAADFPGRARRWPPPGTPPPVRSSNPLEDVFIAMVHERRRRASTPMTGGWHEPSVDDHAQEIY